MPWLWLAVPAALAGVAVLWLRAAMARKRAAAALAARQWAEQQARQAAQARAQAQALAELRATEETTRQQKQARLQAQREASAAEREDRRRAADEAARAHAQSRAAEFAARADEAARKAAALRRATPPPTPTPTPPPPPALAPMPARAEAPAAPGPASVARRPEDTLVMVVDDSRVVRVKVSRLLVAQGYRVAVAENGLAALQQMQTEVPQVVITDAEMPGMDGLELTRRVRAQAHTVKVPVIMISSADASLAPKAAAAGVTALLGKPYGDDELLGHLSRARRGAAHEPASSVRA